MGVTIHNLASLKSFERRLEAASQGRFLPELGRRVSAAFMKEVADEFRESRDPYGNAWAPVERNRRKDRRARARRAARGLAIRSDKPLIDTGRMRGSVIARMVGSAVRVAIPVEYASFHQYGTRFIKRRQILPEVNTGGLGPRWTMALNREASAVLNKALGGEGGHE